MALVRGEDDESDADDSQRLPLPRSRERDGVKGKLVDGEESETDDEDAYHDPEVTHTEANIRVKGTNPLASSIERIRERAKAHSSGEIGKLSETPQQKKLGDANRKLRKDLTTSILSTYQRAIHKADQVGDQLGKSQQVTASCLDDLKHTTIYIDRLSDLLSGELTELPHLRALGASRL